VGLILISQFPWLWCVIALNLVVLISCNITPCQIIDQKFCPSGDPFPGESMSPNFNCFQLSLILKIWSQSVHNYASYPRSWYLRLLLQGSVDQSFGSQWHLLNETTPKNIKKINNTRKTQTHKQIRTHKEMLMSVNAFTLHFTLSIQSTYMYYSTSTTTVYCYSEQ